MVYVASSNQWGRKGQRKVEFHMNPKEKSRIVSYLVSLCFWGKKRKEKEKKKEERNGDEG